MPETMPDFWFVMVVVDGPVKHGFIEDTTLRVSSKAMDTVRYGMVRDDYAKTPEDAVAALLEQYDEETRACISTAKVGRMTEIVEVRL